MRATTRNAEGRQMELDGYLAHAVAGEIFGLRRKRDSAELLSEIEP